MRLPLPCVLFVDPALTRNLTPFLQMERKASPRAPGARRPVAADAHTAEHCVGKCTDKQKADAKAKCAASGPKPGEPAPECDCHCRACPSPSLCARTKTQRRRRWHGRRVGTGRMSIVADAPQSIASASALTSRRRTPKRNAPRPVPALARADPRPADATATAVRPCPRCCPPY